MAHPDGGSTTMPMDLTPGRGTRRHGNGALQGSNTDASEEPSSSDDGGNPPFGCCNANGDPCCSYQHCGGPMTPACACELEGGVPDYQTGGDVACVYDAGITGDGGDAASPDANQDAQADAPSDAPFNPDVGFCCNANPDPCCTVL